MLEREEFDTEISSSLFETKMDLYLPSLETGLSLQEMIESDMKFDGLDSGNLDGPNDLSYFDFDWDIEKPFHNLESMSDVDLFQNLGATSLEKCTQLEEPEPELTDSMGSWMNMSAMSSYNAEDNGGPAINPSQVLPTKISTPKTNNTSIVVNSSANFKTGTFSTSATKDSTMSSQIKVSDLVNGKTYATQGTNTFARREGLTTEKSSNPSDTTMVTSSTLTTPSVQPFVQHQTVTTTTTHPPKHLSYIKGQVNRSATMFGLSKQDRLNRVKNAKQKRQVSTDEKVFPKPAYSYSCLIALALKNSATGSLPVSEIYSFMCEHFPYFRTAPSGWKNSVRHNLSLNKCFEKIEKPVVSGNNQRKGCLWALNPSKLTKMDEEVQKWNKKGLKDIQDAMSYPEVLESLERGEMKFDPRISASCSEDEEDEDDDMKIKTESGTNGLTNIKILNPIATSMVVPTTHKTMGRQYASNVKTFAQLPTTAVVSLAQRVQRNGNNVIQIRSSPMSDTEAADYKPDSTMAEINIQSFGGGFDDDLSLEENLGVVNGKDSSTSFVVKKITTNNTASNLSTLVYSPQTVQKHSLNRVLIANSK